MGASVYRSAAISTCSVCRGFLFTREMGTSTYYRYLEEDDDGGELWDAHNRLQASAKIRLIRAGEAGLMHPGIQKNT